MQRTLVRYQSEDPTIMFQSAFFVNDLSDVELSMMRVRVAETQKRVARALAWTAATDNVVEDCSPLREADFDLIGRLIQGAAALDWLFRVLIDISEEGSPDARNPKKSPRDGELAKIVREKIASILLDEEIAEVDFVFHQLNMISNMRNDFAHWMARRHPNEDVFIILSKNARQGAQRTRDEGARPPFHCGAWDAQEVSMIVEYFNVAIEWVRQKIFDWGPRLNPDAVA